MRPDGGGVDAARGKNVSSAVDASWSCWWDAGCINGVEGGELTSNKSLSLRRVDAKVFSAVEPYVADAVDNTETEGGIKL
jgi:hypothetical protein